MTPRKFWGMTTTILPLFIRRSERVVSFRSYILWVAWIHPNRGFSYKGLVIMLFLLHFDSLAVRFL